MSQTTVLLGQVKCLDAVGSGSADEREQGKSLHSQSAEALRLWRRSLMQSSLARLTSNASACPVSCPKPWSGVQSEKFQSLEQPKPFKLLLQTSEIGPSSASTPRYLQEVEASRVVVEDPNNRSSQTCKWMSYARRDACEMTTYCCLPIAIINNGRRSLLRHLFLVKLLDAIRYCMTPQC